MLRGKGIPGGIVSISVLILRWIGNYIQAERLAQIIDFPLGNLGSFRTERLLI